MMKFALSSANVENVVNPPQIPVFRKRIICGVIFMEDFCAATDANAVAIPIKKQPSRFVKNVCRGKRFLIGINEIK